MMMKIKNYLYHTWGQFHQHAYKQLLRAKIPKAQKDSQVISVFCAFGICPRKSCLQNVGEIDTWL